MFFRSSIKTWSTPVSKEKAALIQCIFCGNDAFLPSLSCDGFSYVKCAKCRLVQINPQPSVSDIENRYTKTYGKDYFFYELENEAAFLELQKKALADAGFEKMELELFRKAKRQPCVLDLGCATGALLAFLRDRGWKARGVEISPSGIYAREKRNLDIWDQTIQNCNFPSESFDVVLASHFIEHLNNPREVIREIWRILRTGGCLMLTTPNISSFQAKLFGNNWRSAIFDHLFLFSFRTIKAMLKAESFAIESINTWGGLAAGTAPLPIKIFADKAVKILGIGDVMLVKAKKP